MLEHRQDFFDTRENLESIGKLNENKITFTVCKNRDGELVYYYTKNNEILPTPIKIVDGTDKEDVYVVLKGQNQPQLITNEPPYIQ